MFTSLISTAAKTLLAGCLFASTTLLANPTVPEKPASFNTSLYITKTNKIRVALEKVIAEPVIISLRLKGRTNEPVFSRQVGRKQDKIAIQLDVSELADGVYELEIKSPTSTVVKQVNLATSTSQIEVTRKIVMP